MAFDAFDEGIKPGGLRSKDEIRLLICYVLSSVGKPFKLDKLIEILYENGIANYFEASEATSSLLKNGNIEPAEKDGYYIITDKGKMISKSLSDELPLSVKEKTVASVLSLIKEEQVEQENPVTIEKLKNGYNVCLSISGGEMDLMKISLFVPERDMAKIVKKNFHKKPELTYKVMLALLTGNNDLIKDVFSDY